MRTPFLLMLAAATPVCLLMGLALATEELAPWILITLIGLGLVYRVVAQLRHRALIRWLRRSSIGREHSCTWAIDDEGVTWLPDNEKMHWSSFRRAIMCPAGLELTGGSLAWFPSEVLLNSEEVHALRQIIPRQRIP